MLNIILLPLLDLRTRKGVLGKRTNGQEKKERKLD